jgi:hypothetical protein
MNLLSLLYTSYELQKVGFDSPVLYLPLPSVLLPGIFLTECARMPFQKFFLRRMQAGTVFRNPFFPGIGISNTIPLQPNFGSLYISGLFKKKKALVTYIYTTHMSD